MTYHKNLSAIMKMGALVLIFVCSLHTPAFAGVNHSAPAAAVGVAPVATEVRATLNGTATRITIKGTAPMAYSVRRPDANSLVVELPGVDASQLAPTYHFTSPLVSAVTVKRAGQTQTSLQIALRAPVRERTQLSENNLVLELWPEGSQDNSAKDVALSAESAATKNITKENTEAQTQTQIASMANTLPQTSQGQRYGQQGFVGEPINLNVVNADIRDILNYITEQYGVNFVVDSSVGKVPVTINVTEVPWNYALDAILRANRLGIEVTGNILRVATQEVLVEESKNRAAEEAAKQRLRDAQLNNSPLVTEIIRLNYARALGTLGEASEGTAVFKGGAGNTADTGQDQNGVSPIQSNASNVGILPIIQRRLSKRGSVEVDGRSNTLIVTDVKENIDAVRQLVSLLDQPEPQVEIETRIVIANRSFSRDLGVQLGAVAINSNQGALGSFSTLPSNTTRTSGPNALGTPGGLANTAQALDSLRATGASTVIGLTTGIIGTAQISALITAAEAKGQAKIVATPRVTALNNRPAQIESGSQIPVVTPQASAAGASGVFTTTFVSVPLRLSITPQITDAGTVVLRVVMENNSVNGTLTNSLGTPGIDTQRMQTEVLVPDGGTTVVGGVLNDRESEIVNRTPGLGGLPVIGNLFKRKAISRNTDEILFFITPRIYRPDYQGRRMDSAPANSTRSVQISQPVPLGNPETNTPPSAPSQQQQQQQQPLLRDQLPLNSQPATPGVRP